MKSTLPLLLAVSLCGSGATLANPRGLGPSGMQAAHLKAHAPANYIAHYLPDDRYKIAGGIWKFVATDLDTYYHIPSSPNILRQPADRVIGFANVADAEEAGYTADPTDGTAERVAMASVARKVQGKAAFPKTSPVLKALQADGGKSLGSDKIDSDTRILKGDDDSLLYMTQVIPLMEVDDNNLDDHIAALRVVAVIQQPRGFGGNVNDPTTSGLFAELDACVAKSETIIQRFKAVSPPKRLAKLASLYGQFLQSTHDVMASANKAVRYDSPRNEFEFHRQIRDRDQIFVAIHMEEQRLRKTPLESADKGQ